MMERIMFSICRKARHGNEPKYYICARRDNGFIPAYRAYFFIKGNKIKRVSCMRYEHSVTFGKRADDFTYFSPGYYVFNIKARNSDPSEWKIGQNEYEKVRYDINALITLLKKSEITLKGYIELVLHEFDGYQLIHMTRTDQEGHGTILGEQSLFFRDGNPIKIGRRIKFDADGAVCGCIMKTGILIFGYAGRRRRGNDENKVVQKCSRLPDLSFQLYGFEQ